MSNLLKPGSELLKFAPIVFKLMIGVQMTKKHDDTFFCLFFSKDTLYSAFDTRIFRRRQTDSYMTVK